MPLQLLFASFALMLGGGALALAAGRDGRRATLFGAGGAAAGGVLGFAFALGALSGLSPETFREPWGFPYGTFYLEADALSAFFLLVLFLVTTLCALFGAAYLPAHAHGRPLGPAWFHFNALTVAMALVFVARNGLLFLIAWEAMALTSFLLVMFDASDPRVRRAGWTYLVATHLGTALVLLLFGALGAQAGSLDFDRLAANGAALHGLSGPLFLLAVLGFGAKAGFVPLHVWLPEAHPAAPSHVSAVMSGIMIKTGIYAILRVLNFLGPPDAWWGWVLVGVGVSSGVLGVLFALAQHDLKRLLAYHSVENIGIIALGLGVGVLGLASGAPAVAFLGFAGALLHVLNHAVFKSLLFLAAGAVADSTHTRDIEHMGGLLRRMPLTGASFLVGSAAIAGLPPFNGFVSEFLILVGAFLGASTLGAPFALPLAAVVGALALIGGLAAACFVKAVGVVFLGEPRGEGARLAREAHPLMTAPTAALAAVCVAVGLGAPFVVLAVVPPVVSATSMSPFEALAAATSAQDSLAGLATAGALVIALVAGLTLLRGALLRSRPVERAPTWDCGYIRPTARMQYSASSFAAPLTSYFRSSLRTRTALVLPEGPFPREASFRSETSDVFLRGWYTPVFVASRRALSRILPLQNGRVQFYVLYIVASLLALLIWEMV